MSTLTRDSFMECQRHGRQGVTFVCQHLQHGKGLGFFVPDAPPTQEEPWKMAWCNVCEKIREEEAGWNDRSEAFAGSLAICAGCFEEIRARNFRAKRKWWKLWE
jgi:hypothetical protein